MPGHPALPVPAGPATGGQGLLLFLTGPPHASDLVTTVLRLADAILRQGGTVRVWACGYATLLTQRSLGENKPANMRAWREVYPTTATIVARLLADYQGRLTWDVCRFCSDERGACGHIPQVRVRSPLRLGEVMSAVPKVLYLGGA